MNNFKVFVKMYKNNLKKLSDAQIKALLMTAEQMRTEIIDEQVIPFQTGNLQNVATDIDKKNTKKGLVTIYHNTPYARRLYFHPEYNFDQTFNRHAKGQWWEDWLRGSKKDRPRKLYKKFYKMSSGGVVK
jgi:hypothetical protein